MYESESTHQRLRITITLSASMIVDDPWRVCSSSNSTPYKENSLTDTNLETQLIRDTNDTVFTYVCECIESAENTKRISFVGRVTQKHDSEIHYATTCWTHETRLMRWRLITISLIYIRSRIRYGNSRLPIPIGHRETLDWTEGVIWSGTTDVTCPSRVSIVCKQLRVVPCPVIDTNKSFT